MRPTLLLLALPLLAACCPDTQVTYRIPPERKADAARMVEALVKANHGAFRDNSLLLDQAWQTAAKVYGEPVATTHP